MDIQLLIGYIALVFFFAVILLSLMGGIPQNKIPIQTALFITGGVIAVLAAVGNVLSGGKILIFGPTELAGMIIVHPITALAAGFLVAGALEAAGAFEAAADALGLMEKTPLGVAGTATILINLPTIVAMPCGRILAAALIPAAIVFGMRIAKNTGDARLVGVVVFAFIVNAAASCGPSPLGGIGMIGEGMGRLPLGALSSSQSAGIMLCSGVCALAVKYITPLFPGGEASE